MRKGRCEMSRGRVTGGRRRALIGVASGVSVLVLWLGAGAFASTLKFVVPGPTGTAAGQNYHYWLKRAWEFYFNSPAPGPTPCQTVTVNGKSVAVLPNIGNGRSTCSEPRGRPIYINELSTQCSTLPGHLPNSG